MHARRIVGSVLAAMAGSIAIAGLSQAQEAFPTRTVRVVIPYPAGGGTDTIGRLVADLLSRKWGQTVVVENIGGAAGNVGAAQVFKAAADGHTLMITSPGPVATNAFLYKTMPFDPARWTSISLLATGPYVLAVSNSFGATTVKDLVARAKTNPGKVKAATPGAGSVGHLALVQLEMLAGITTTQVPYKGLSPALNDLVGGHVDLMFDTPTTTLPLHQGGKVKMIGTGTPERVPEFSDVPTIAESLPGYRAVTWYAMVAPPAMPAALADRINRDVNEILGRKEVAERVRGIQMSPVTRGRAEAASFFADESQLWGKVIKAAKISPQ
jgi:tripartite-type tricarboxylate transporter receptor subunit TctC